MKCGAELSACLQYRYSLWREWDDTKKRLCWIMLNPSTADALKDDATIRVCMGRAKRMGYGSIDVVNLFALRATHPEELYRHSDPITHRDAPTRNAEATLEAIDKAGFIICAWGQHGAYKERGRLMLSTIRGSHLKAYALKINLDGSPAHPLRISYDVQPREMP